MHDEIGIAADGRGEMGVAAQVEAEMPVVLRGILGLRLRAQHHLVDEFLDIAAFHPRQNPIEAVGTKRAARYAGLSSSASWSSPEFRSRRPADRAAPAPELGPAFQPLVAC